MLRGLAVRALRVARWLCLAFAVALASAPAQADNDYYDNVQGGAAGKSAAPRLALQNGDVELVSSAKQEVMKDQCGLSANRRSGSHFHSGR